MEQHLGGLRAKEVEGKGENGTKLPLKSNGDADTPKHKSSARSTFEPFCIEAKQLDETLLTTNSQSNKEPNKHKMKFESLKQKKKKRNA